MHPPELLASRALRPLLDDAHRFVRDRARACDLRVSESARGGLVGALERRVREVCAQVWAAEQRAAALLGVENVDEGASSDCDAWQRRRADYPVLAQLLDELTRGWCAHVEEFLTRLRADWALLHGDPQASAPALEQVEAAGDPHVGGRSVLLFDVGAERAFAYKPKDLRVSAWVQRLFGALNAAGHEPTLPIYEVYPREGYGWERRVLPAPCPDLCSVELFYRRFGSLLRIFQWLGARDLWMDNLIARGAEPVFIDLEMVMQPLVTNAASESAAERRARAFLDESLASSALLSMIVAIAPGTRAEDLGALMPGGRFKLPYRADAQLDALRGLAGESADGFRTWSCAAHAPTLAGGAVEPLAFVPSIEQGYRASHEFLCSQRALLSSLLETLDGQVRHVPRSTWSTWALIRVGLSASFLRDSAARERLFEPLLQHAREPWQQSLARCEIASWEAAEIPYFLAPIDETVLRCARGEVVHGALAESALARVRRRLEELPGLDLKRHVGLLRTLATRESVSAEASVDRSATDRGLVAAMSHAEVLLETAFAEDGELRWVGRVFEPRHGVAPVGVLTDELPTGMGGLAVLFAELHVASGRALFREAALACARLIVLPGANEQGDVGLFGAGGRFYALSRCALLLDDSTLRQRAEAWAFGTDFVQLTGEAPMDLISGAYGLLLALLGSIPLVGTGPAARAIEAMAQRAPSPADSRACYAPVARLACLPDAASAARIAASRAQRQLGVALPWLAPCDENAPEPLTWPEGAITPSPDPFDPSAVWGLGACARRALRDHDPSLVPSLILMEPATAP